MFVVALAVAGVMVSNGPLAAAASAEYFFDFDYSLGPFQVFGDTPLTSNLDPGALALNHNCYVLPGTTDLDSPSNGCVVLTHRGSGSLVAMLAQLKGSGITVRVEFDARALDGCEYCAPVVYAGNGKPTGPESFQDVGSALSNEWTHYGYWALLDGSNPVVAVGIRDERRGWTGRQRAELDNLWVQFLDD
jgi:hypothetical protein